MIADVKKTAEQKMHKSLDALKTDLGKVRTGRAHTGILDHIDDFNVSLRDSEGEFHSWLRDRAPGLKVEIQDPLAKHAELLDQYTDQDMHNIVAYLETLK